MLGCRPNVFADKNAKKLQKVSAAVNKKLIDVSKWYKESLLKINPEELSKSSLYFLLVRE